MRHHRLAGLYSGTALQASLATGNFAFWNYAEVETGIADTIYWSIGAGVVSHIIPDKYTKIVKIL